MKSKWVALAMISALLLPVYGWAETAELTIVIKNHRFEPAEITVPAGKKVKLVIDNQDATPGLRLGSRLVLLQPVLAWPSVGA